MSLSIPSATSCRQLYQP